MKVSDDFFKPGNKIIFPGMRQKEFGQYGNHRGDKRLPRHVKLFHKLFSLSINDHAAFLIFFLPS